MTFVKEEIYEWFKNLDGSKRIQFLNGILHFCFPLELRFIGTCIEDLARSSYNYLKDAELKANTLSEVSTMNDLTDRIQRSKLIVTLALLNSSNQECARTIFNIIVKFNIVSLFVHSKERIDDKVTDEYLLLLTMAANHPALEFIMKTVISDQLKHIEQMFEIEKQKQSEAEEAAANAKHESENYTTANTSTSSRCSSSSGGGGESSSGLIKVVRLEGVNHLNDPCVFRINTEWSDGLSTQIVKTYAELCEFHSKLIAMHSGELEGILKPNEIEFKENQKEDFIKELLSVTEYCEKIVKIPQAIAQSDYVISFFKSTPPVSSNTGISGSNTKATNEKVVFTLNSPESSESKCNDDCDKTLTALSSNASTIKNEASKEREKPTNDEALDVPTSACTIDLSHFKQDNKISSSVINENVTASSPCMSPSPLVSKQQQQVALLAAMRQNSSLSFPQQALTSTNTEQNNKSSSSIRMKQSKNRTISNQSEDFNLKNVEPAGGVQDELSSSVPTEHLHSIKNLEKLKHLQNDLQAIEAKNCFPQQLMQQIPKQQPMHYFMGSNNEQIAFAIPAQHHPSTGYYPMLTHGSHMLHPYPPPSQMRFQIGPSPTTMPSLQPDTKLNTIDSASSAESTSPTSSQSPGLTAGNNSKKSLNNNEVNPSDDDRTNAIENGNHKNRKHPKSTPNLMNKLPQQQQHQIIQIPYGYDPRYIPQNVQVRNPGPGQASFQHSMGHYIHALPQGYLHENRALFTPPPGVTLHQQMQIDATISGTATPPLMPTPQPNDLNIITNQKLNTKQQPPQMSPSVNVNKKVNENKPAKQQQQQRTNKTQTTNADHETSASPSPNYAPLMNENGSKQQQQPFHFISPYNHHLPPAYNATQHLNGPFYGAPPTLEMNGDPMLNNLLLPANPNTIGDGTNPPATAIAIPISGYPQNFSLIPVICNPQQQTTSNTGTTNGLQQQPPINLIPAYPTQQYNIANPGNFKYSHGVSMPQMYPNDIQSMGNNQMNEMFVYANHEPFIGTNVNNNYLKNSHFHQKKKSCYNCGMHHMGSECREPTYDSMSSQSQFRLNYKPQNNENNNSSSASLVKNTKTNEKQQQQAVKNEEQKTS